MLTHNGLELRPTNPRLTRVRVDLAMAGAEIDLTGTPAAGDGGIDLTVRVLMAGMAVRVPADWRVWWQFRGVGGIGGRRRGRSAPTTSTPPTCGCTPPSLFGGIGIEAG